MPVSPHPNCHEPQNDTVICRFMDFGKFYDLLATEELYFRRTDLFKETDPQEALASDQYLRAALGLRRYDINDEIRLIDTQGFDRQNSEAYYINCWQIFEGETLEMWGKYGKGVVVFSHFHLLRAAIDGFIDPMYVGVVRYGEKDMRGVNLINFLFTKRKCYEKERELRVVLQSYNPVGGANRHISPEGVYNREPLNELYPLPEWVHECKRRRIDLKPMITGVTLSPWTTNTERERVAEWLKVKQFGWPVSLSVLTSPHTPTPDEMKKYGFSA